MDKKGGSIAVFDSGVGGLTVLSEVTRALPHEDIIYYGDAASCPYGTKSAARIKELTTAAVERLTRMGVKMVIIACNTATAYAIDYLRESFPIPFIAIEPAVKPAIKATLTKRIAVVATQGTLSGERLERLCSTAPSDIVIIKSEGSGFVELVEQSMEQSAEADRQVERVIAPLIERGVDQIILGCTHYPFLLQSIEKVIRGRGVSVINPAEAVALRAADILQKEGILSENSSCGTITFTSSLSEEYNRSLKIKFNNYHF